MLQTVSHDCHVTIWALKMASTPNVELWWSNHDAECWNSVAVMTCDANTHYKGPFYTSWIILVLKLHAVRASALPQVWKQFAPSLYKMKTTYMILVKCHWPVKTHCASQWQSAIGFSQSDHHCIILNLFLIECPILMLNTKWNILACHACYGNVKNKNTLQMYWK